MGYSVGIGLVPIGRNWVLEWHFSCLLCLSVSLFPFGVSPGGALQNMTFLYLLSRTVSNNLIDPEVTVGDSSRQLPQSWPSHPVDPGHQQGCYLYPIYGSPVCEALLKKLWPKPVGKLGLIYQSTLHTQSSRNGSVEAWNGSERVDIRRGNRQWTSLVSSREEWLNKRWHMHTVEFTY